MKPGNNHPPTAYNETNEIKKSLARNVDKNTPRAAQQIRT